MPLRLLLLRQRRSSRSENLLDDLLLALPLRARASLELAPFYFLGASDALLRGYTVLFTLLLGDTVFKSHGRICFR